MARQKSFVKLEGRIGDLTFYKTQNGYQAREKGGVSASRIANDPKFQRTRENNAEFGRANSSAKKLRDAFRAFIQLTSDSRMTNRLNSRMMRVLKADAISDRGERQVRDENLGILNRFSFNAAALLSNTLFEKVESTINRSAGTGTISLSALDPTVKIAKPAGATHFQFSAAIAAVDFSTGEESDYVFDMQESELSPMNIAIEATELIAGLPLADIGDMPLFLGFGVSFYQEVNGKHYPLNNGAFNSLSIVKIDTI